MQSLSLATNEDHLWLHCIQRCCTSIKLVNPCVTCVCSCWAWWLCSKCCIPHNSACCWLAKALKALFLSLPFALLNAGFFLVQAYLQQLHLWRIALELCKLCWHPFQRLRSQECWMPPLLLVWWQHPLLAEFHGLNRNTNMPKGYSQNCFAQKQWSLHMISTHFLSQLCRHHGPTGTPTELLLTSFWDTVGYKLPEFAAGHLGIPVSQNRSVGISLSA